MYNGFQVPSLPSYTLGTPGLSGYSRTHQTKNHKNGLDSYVASSWWGHNLEVHSLSCSNIFALAVDTTYAMFSRLQDLVNLP